MGICHCGGRQMSDFRGSQLGDLTQGNVAETIYNVTTSLEQSFTLLKDEIARLNERINLLEVIERQHNTERASLTRLITQLAVESRSVKDVHDLLTRQIDADGEDRNARRHYLDMMLLFLVILAVVNLVFAIIRVFRGAGRAA